MTLAAEDQPLAEIRVIEFSHMVMGPSVGVILADLGADVIRVEPPGGDRTRKLLMTFRGAFDGVRRRLGRTVVPDVAHRPSPPAVDRASSREAQ